MKKPKRAKCKENERELAWRRKLQAICLCLNISNALLCETVDEAIAAAEKAAEWARFHIEQRGRENDSLRDFLKEGVEREKVFVRFFDDVNLILCGSKWINAASLLEARNRYAKAMEEIQ